MCVCVCVCERERERERERQRETERQRDRERQGQIKIETQTDRDRETDRQEKKVREHNTIASNRLMTLTPVSAPRPYTCLSQGVGARLQELQILWIQPCPDTEATETLSLPAP